MSGTSTSSTAHADGGRRWAELDKRNERLVEACDPLLAELRREPGDHDREAAAAS